MKTASINTQEFSTPAQLQSFNSLNIASTIMKKLTNVSPFLLLLVPVFVMIALTFTMTNNSQNEEMTAKTANTTKEVAKVSIISYK